MADHFVHKDKLFVSWLTVIPVIVIFNKNYVKQILTKNDADILNKSEIGYKAVDDLAPDGLFTGNFFKNQFHSDDFHLIFDPFFSPII